MFSLLTSTEQLKGYQQSCANAQTQQYAPTSAVTGASFAQGQISIPYAVAGTKWLVIGKSYLRVRATLSYPQSGAPVQVPLYWNTANGLNPLDGITLGMAVVANLFQSIEYRIRGVTVSRIPDFVPHVDMIEKRTRMSKVWLDSVGSTHDFYQPSFQTRLGLTSGFFPEGQIPNQNINPPSATNNPYPKIGGVAAAFRGGANFTAGQTQLIWLSQLGFFVNSNVVQYGANPPFAATNLPGNPNWCDTIAWGPYSNNSTFPAAPFAPGSVPVGGQIMIQFSDAAATPYGSNVQIANIFQPGDYVYFNLVNVLQTLTQVIQGVVQFIIPANPGYQAFPAGPSLQTIVIGNGSVAPTVPTPVGNTWTISTGSYMIPDYSSFPLQGMNRLELIWQPPLSIFKVPHALPSSSHELVLTPKPGVQYQLAVVESQYPVNTSDFQFNIDDLYFYGYLVDSKPLTDGRFFLDLEETTCQTGSLQAITGLQQVQFDTSPSTYALAVAYQSNNTGMDGTVTTSKFRIQNNFILYENPAANPLIAGVETSIIRFYLQYANMTIPQPDADPKFNVNGLDSGVNNPKSVEGGYNRLMQRWFETQINTAMYYNPGGCETLQDWVARGMYFYFPTLRDGLDRSVRVMTNSSFAIPPVNANILLFTFARKVAELTISGGAVTDVLVQNQ
jgi:hypothetical protein